MNRFHDEKLEDFAEAQQGDSGGCQQEPCSVSSARREVIENKLLAALEDEGQVAILATEIDLILFIKAMAYYDTPDSREMAKDLLQLKRAAFPQNEKSDAR